MSKARISDQGIDAGVCSNVDEVLVELAPGNTERPLGARIQQRSEWNTDDNEEQVGHRQTQHDRVGGCPQAVIAGDRCHDRQVPDEPEYSDDAEYDRYNATEHPSDPAVRRPRTDVGLGVHVRRIGRVGRPVVNRTTVVVGGGDLDNVGGCCCRIHEEC